MNRTGKRKLMFISLTGDALSYFIIATLLFLREKISYTSSLYTLFNWIATISLLFSTFSTSVGIDKVVRMRSMLKFFQPSFEISVQESEYSLFQCVERGIVSKSYLYIWKIYRIIGMFSPLWDFVYYLLHNVLFYSSWNRM